ncbi:hypothetical protein BCR35DRAFT_301104 [Leucosporidium creatinivorum]|uniref:Zn(2)-C6 fungal-type domain-containing protein n=1 Tax=Leucosporidium creatinivorum TaxID=106004 RepID=A0A1Y2FXN0_9BASI|nr:hypothetical protein BCR35DRAFT_301104 [Leucosporidium creatinivorum]
MADGSSTRHTPTDAKPPGKVARLARSRAACEACHKVKQRCDGPSVCPCHRCKTWGIECVFPSSAGRAASASTLKKGKGAATTSTPVPAAAPSPTPSVQAGPDVAEQLRVMTERLQSIEATLARAQVTFPQTSPANASHSHSGNTVSGESPMTNASQLHEHKPGNSNPLETAGEAMAVEGLVDLSGPGRGVETWDAIRPDVLGRSLMTLEECDSEFDIYFRRLQPWTTLLSSTLDRHPLVVRERSPLLFHAILLTTIYYRPRTSENQTLYRNVSSIVDSILAPQILCPQPDQLSPDFIRALQLLLIYKPVQISMFNARGVSDPSAIEHASKMNVRASWLLRLLISRVTAFIGLPSITTAFARAFANQHLSPIPDQIIAEQRMYFACVFHESHGALQSGKPANFIPHEALKTTRLFAALKQQPCDVRLAASVELAATAATVLSRRQEGDLIEVEDLKHFDEEMDAWSEYWTPILAAESDDELAWTASFPYAAFIRVVVNGFSFSRWKAQKKAMLAQAMQPVMLSEGERGSILKAVQAAEGILLAVSVEGKTSNKEKGIVPSWQGVRQMLTLDREMANSLRWATDSLACVCFSYPLIFLAKIANEGLLGPNLTLIPSSTAAVPLSPLAPNDKLCRLLQLGADFLDAVAPNPHHPAVKQAAFLRRIREAGIGGRRSVMSAPGSPREGVRPQPPLTGPPLGGTNGFSVAPPPLHAQANGHTQGSMASYPDFSLATSYDPSPLHSPPQINQVDDPFSALLSGVSPSMFDASGAGGGGVGGFFGMDGGFGGAVRWEDMETDMGLGLGGGGGAGSRGFFGDF